MQILKRDSTIKIPTEIATCQICGAEVVIEDIDEWEQADDGLWRATEGGLHVTCSTEPDIDADGWSDWMNGHFSTPYIDWLPIGVTVFKWMDANYRFASDDFGDDASMDSKQLADDKIAKIEQTINEFSFANGSDVQWLIDEIRRLNAVLDKVDAATNRIDKSLTPTIDRVKAMESLIEIGREMRDVLDADLLCPDCGKMDGHLSRCTAARWDMALQVERNSQKTAAA